MDADKLVKAYIKIRTARDEATKEFEEKKAKLTEDLNAVESALLDILKETGQEGGKTAHGTYTRTTKERFWTSDWPEFYKVVNEHQAPELLEQRIHQGNFKTFLANHPDALPPGVNVDRRYAITVRRATSQ
jgi:hypothetical protein